MKIRPSKIADAKALARMCVLWAKASSLKGTPQGGVLRRKAQKIARSLGTDRMGEVLAVAANPGEEARESRKIRAAMREGVREAGGTLPMIIHAGGRGWRDLPVSQIDLHPVTTGVKNAKRPPATPSEETRAA